MVWRDIDLAVSSPGLSIERAFEIMHPLLTHPYVKQVRYFHQSGHFKLTGLDERYYFMVFYDLHEQANLTILQIKDAWYQLPAYRSEVYSTDIYDAVLQHGVCTLTAFDQYLAQRGKPTRSGK
jgi:hypothetical protein